MTQAAVSQQIAQLEERLGVQLFVRMHRKVELTEEGRSLAAALQTSFEQIGAAIRRIKRRQDHRILKLVMFPTLAIRWMLPRMAHFHERHPDLDVQITTSMKLVDFVNDDVDFSILYNEQVPKGVIATPIFSEVLTPVCSPKLIDGQNLDVADIGKYTWIHSTNRLSNWASWVDFAGLNIKPSGPQMFLGNSYLAYQAAIDGMGFAMAQLAYVEQDLKEGRLIAPFPQRHATNRTYSLTYLETRKDVAKIRHFRDWILAEAGVSAPEPL